MFTTMSIFGIKNIVFKLIPRKLIPLAKIE